MKAIFEDRDRQYTVQVGDTIVIDKMADVEKDAEITFDKLMMIIDDKATKIGTPYVAGATVKAKVLDNDIRDPKIIVFKFKRRKNYKRTKGHKEQRTLIKIESINA
ncbi:MAG: 50S ribosomal protein L21 [Spirochaetota bacterium]|jgi:large subunit ribosomal protein L21|nr:50S ribosomal protein L21 [Spirochaetota bacterium]